MKKVIITALMILTIITFNVIPFTVVKAADYVRKEITINGETVGTVNSIFTDDFSIAELQGINSNDYTGAIITYVQLNEYYTGYIDFIFNNSMWSDVNFILQGDGAYYSGYSNSNDTIQVQINYSNSFTLILLTQLNPFINIKLSNISYSLTETDNNVVNEFFDSFNQYQIIDHYFPSWNLTAYLWGKSYGEYTKMYGLDLPFIYIPRSTSASYEINHRIPILRNQKIVIYFLSDQFISNANTYVSTASGVSVVKSNIQYNFPRLQIGSSNQVFYLNELSVDLGDQAATQFSVGFNVANVHIYPVFIGNYDNIPDTVALMKSGEYRNTYTKLLQQIIDSLNGQNNPTNPSSDLDNTTNEIVDLQDQESQIVSGFQDDLTQFNTNMDLSDYDFITGFQNSNNYFKMLLDNMYVNSSDVRAFWIIPVILVLFMAITGRK